MAKLEEITALLTEEIEGFNTSVTKLEKLSKNLKEVKVKADASRIEYLLETHLKRLERFEATQEKNTKELLNSLNRSRLFPKWSVAIGSFFVVLLLVLGFTTLSYRHKNRELKYNVIRLENHYLDFLKEHPKIEEQYLNWANPKENQAK
ncbi:hypothetical protein HX109_07910 [Galbibacter sp. BG1]|uniref:DUF6730 family protein n=1 Tax=Galbibacter sp. BG1 TaxID=1170699 RepID=UPI0015C0D7FE|nr:DUF6730 family protein [Galbibacter sp. BG1]QLE01494.1 hypothetical protein HX109_07910 [Galbibacter sp. BG1]